MGLPQHRLEEGRRILQELIDDLAPTGPDPRRAIITLETREVESLEAVLELVDQALGDLRDL